MVRALRHIGTASMLLLALALPDAARAAVTASVDRDEVELNESFTLKVTVDTAIDTVPDTSALEEDFYIGSTSQLSNTTIVNGQISRSRTWSYVLMAKRDGELVIPPVVVGTEQSHPLRITVSPQSAALPGEADIFVTSEVDHTESYVQAQILYTVKVYRAVATRQPRLSDLALDGVEVISEVAGEERSYDAILNDKAYNVVERVYALFPQESGTLSIEPARFEARVLRDGRITGRKVFESDAIEVKVNPIPAPPQEFPGAAWLPAKSVELSEDWSRPPAALHAGEPVTRHITIVVLGQLETQIPVIEPEVSDTVKVYPDKPDLRKSAVPKGILASRKDQYALIGTEAGTVELPPVSLPWWNIDAGAWDVAELPGRTLEILPAANAMPPPPPVVSPSIDDGSKTAVVHGDLWRDVSMGIGGLWLATILAWWWSRRPAAAPREPEEPPLHKQQARWLKTARKAALAGDASGVKEALLAWSRLQWPQHPPRNIGDLALRVSDPLAKELHVLCKWSYGPHGAHWDGERLAKAMRSFAVLPGGDDRDATPGLPPLMPGRPA
ncbi:MAG: BatD family protein [Woeseiaceae bacterium]